MDLSYRDWIKSLDAGKRAAVTLVQVEEIRLWDAMVEVLKQSLAAQGSLDFNFDLLEAEGLTGEALMTSLETLPLFSPYRLVVLKDLPVRKDQVKSYETLLQSLVDYAEAPNETTLLYLMFRDPPYKGKAYKALRQASRMVLLQRLNARELQNFIGKELARLQVKTDPGTLAFLAQYSGYLDRDSTLDLYAVENMTAKAAGAAKDGLLTREEAEGVLVSRDEENIFAILDALSERRPAPCLQAYHTYLSLGGDPYRLFAMIRRQVRLLNSEGVLRDQGRSPAETQKALGIHPYENKKLYRNAGNFSLAELQAMHGEVFAMEAELKTGGKGLEDQILIFLARWSRRR